MNRFKLDQLQTLVAVSRYESVSKAANAMNLTQPAVTTRIKSLEDALGLQIFERDAKGMKLTKRGSMLLQFAEQFQHLSDLLEERVVDPKSVDQLLRIGVSETIAQSWLPNFIGALRLTYPDLKVEISVDISITLREQLLAREIDLAILLGPISDYTVDNVSLPSVPLAWFRSSQGDQSLPVNFNEIPITTYAKNTRPYRELKSAMFERFGADISLFPSSSLSSCFRLVEAGLCVGALPVNLAEGLVEAGQLVKFDPGWVPEPLQFSASFLGEPKNHLLGAAAAIAKECADLNIK